MNEIKTGMRPPLIFRARMYVCKYICEKFKNILYYFYIIKMQKTVFYYQDNLKSYLILKMYINVLSFYNSHFLVILK